MSQTFLSLFLQHIDETDKIKFFFFAIDPTVLSLFHRSSQADYLSGRIRVSQSVYSLFTVLYTSHVNSVCMCMYLFLCVGVRVYVSLT